MNLPSSIQLSNQVLASIYGVFDIVQRPAVRAKTRHVPRVGAPSFRLLHFVTLRYLLFNFCEGFIKNRDTQHSIQKVISGEVDLLLHFFLSKLQ